MDGRLGDHFAGVGAKKLSATEAIGAGVSNGHELSASGPVLDMLGRVRMEFPCRYLYFADGDYLEDESTITLYDARANQPRRSAEWRLYYPAGCQPMEAMRAGDWCWVALDRADQVVVVVATPESAEAPQLDRLFGTNLHINPGVIPVKAQPFTLVDLADAGDQALDVDDADLLLTLGVSPAVGHDDRLPEMVARFGGRYPMPPVATFTEYAREITHEVDPEVDPDQVLYDWVTTTNDLFFLYERHVLQPVLDADLANRAHIDVDTFFALATRLKNSRFSRAGKSFEQHIAALLDALRVRHGSPARMSDGSKPDFLLPSVADYVNPGFPDQLLTFLAAKTTTKERWRQVVTEGTRSPVRHLITMDRELNADVLNAMDANGVVPVVPLPVQAQYPPELAARMMSVRKFLDLVADRQKIAIDSQLIEE